MARWLITGGCGFIGTNLAEALLQAGGHQVRVLDNLSVGTREDLAAVASFREEHGGGPWAWDGLGLVSGDILDLDRVRQACAGAEVVAHLAANTGVGPSVADPLADCRSNVLGTVHCLEAARRAGARRFVFASSGAPVGECVPPIHEELPAHPVSPYGASKLAGEGYCSAYFRSFGLEAAALRFGNVYGPRSTHKSSVVAQFITRALRGEPLEIYGDGAQTRDFIHVDDLVAAVLAAAAAPGVGGEAFQIATSREHSVLELVELLQAVLAGRGLAPAAVVHAAPRTGDVRRNYSDTAKAAARLGWSAQIGLRQGLDATLDWFLGRVEKAGGGPAAAGS